MGMSVMAVARDVTLAARAINDVAACVWALRDAFLAPIPKLDVGWPDVIARARQGRVVVADVADGPGAGGTADEVTLLRKLLESPAPFVSGFHMDPAVAAEAARLGVGASGKFVFGTTRGFVRNPELVVSATVVRTGIVSYCNTGPMMHGARLDGGLGAVLAVSNGFVLVTSERIQAYDVNAFISQGVDLQAASVIALKTSAHFRASYTALATGGIVLVDADGWSSPDLRQYAFTRVHAPRLPFQPLSASAWCDQIQQQLDARGLGCRSLKQP
jgi:microcystin degradation protein MlrC